MSNIQPISKIEEVIIGGDLSKLSPEERLSYYKLVCDSVGLNPYTEPFKYIPLSGKLTLYATRSASDQLRKIHGVSITKIDPKVENGILTVTVHGKDKEGREDVATASLVVEHLKGLALANEHMKCETKAKRRLTLSICGLGMLDETEVSDIPESTKYAPPKDIFEKSKDKLPAPFDAPEEVEEVANDLGEYVIKFGKKLKGMKLKEVDQFDLDKYLMWLKEQASSTGRPLTGDALELAQIGEAYLKTQEVKKD